MNKKETMAQKMVLHTHYDRKSGKMVKAMVPAKTDVTSKWPKGHGSTMKEQMRKTAENHEFQKKTGRAWND